MCLVVKSACLEQGVIQLFAVMMKNLFLLPLVLPLIASGEVAPKTPPVLAASAASRDTPGWVQRHQSFVATAAKGEAKLVFLGDSITQGWEGAGDIWKAEWAPYQAANFGIGGDRTEHVLWRVRNGNFDGIRPKLVVLMIGTNNTRNQGVVAPEHGNVKYVSPPEHTAAGVKAILDELGRKSPDSKVLLLAIFPRGKGPDDPLRLKNEETNKLLEPMADGRRVFFLNINRKFLDAEGRLSNEIAPDFLHLSKKGYQIWADAIADEVRRLMEM